MYKRYYRRKRKQMAGIKKKRTNFPPGMMIRPKLGNQTHYFKRVVNMANWTNTQANGVVTDAVGITAANSKFYFNIYHGSAAYTPVYGWTVMNFQLKQVPDYAEFTGLFDRYQIAGIKIKIIPYLTAITSFDTSGAGAGNGGGVQSMPITVHSIIDHDDSNNIGGSTDAYVNQLRQYESYKVNNLAGRPIKRFFKPRIAMAGYAGTFTGYANFKNIWIDAASNDIQHYGLKLLMCCVPSCNPTYDQKIPFEIEATFYIKCKDLH